MSNLKDAIIAPAKGKGKRGASYPICNLQDAISKVEKLRAEEGKHQTPVAVAMQHWGYGSKSSGGRQLVSTLIQYGLVQDNGSGQNRTVQLSKTALDILLLDKNSPKHKQGILEAFVKPKIFSDIISRFPPIGDGSDSNLRHFLETEKNINMSVVNQVISNFRESLEYSGFGKESGEEESLEEIQEGDYIQWESEGVLQFKNPKKVRAIIEEKGQYWVFVEDSEAGIPMEQAIIEQRNSSASNSTPLIPPTMPLPTYKTGEVEFMSGILDEKVSMRINIIGAAIPTEKHLTKMIKLLELQKELIKEDA